MAAMTSSLDRLGVEFGPKQHRLCWLCNHALIVATHPFQAMVSFCFELCMPDPASLLRSDSTLALRYAILPALKHATISSAYAITPITKTVPVLCR